MAHALEVDALKDLQGLDAYRSLAPRTAGVDVDPLIGPMGRSLDSDMEIGQVLHGKEATVLLVESHHLLGDLTLVEKVPGGLDRGFPALGGVLPLNLDQALEAAGQVLLHQNLASLEAPPSGEEDLGGGGPVGLAAALVGQVVPGFGQIRGQCRWHGEAVLRQLHRRGDHLLKSHSTVEFQGGHPGVGSCWGHRAGYAGGQVAAELGQVVFDVGGFRPTSQAADGNSLSLLGIMDDDRGHAAKVGPLGQHHVQGDSSRHTGVSGVPALFQDPVTRRRSQVMPGRDHMGHSRNCGTVGLDSYGHVAPPW